MRPKKTLIYLLALAFFIVLLQGCDGPAEEAGEEVDEAVQMQKEQLEDAQEKIAEAKAQIEDLQEELTEARQERDQARARLEESEQERQRILAEMERSGAAVKQTENSMDQDLSPTDPELQDTVQPSATESTENGRPTG